MSVSKHTPQDSNLRQQTEAHYSQRRRPTTLNSNVK